MYKLICIITSRTVGVEFTEEPSHGTATNGSSVAFVCFVDGSDPISYQWFKDGTELQGENNYLLRLDPILYNDYGVYHCVVNNSVNNIQSRGAMLTGVYDALQCYYHNISCSSGTYFLLNLLTSSVTRGLCVKLSFSSSGQSNTQHNIELFILRWSRQHVSVVP